VFISVASTHLGQVYNTYHEPPHWMILYPVPATSGLATTPKSTGTWIMYARTPWAHLIVNGKP
jgi:hypothetical protein